MDDNLLLVIDLLIIVLGIAAIFIVRAIKSRPVKPEDISECPFCGTAPRPRMVGDNKQYVIMICPNCKCTVRACDAKWTVRDAVKVWNKRVKEYKDDGKRDPV